MPFKYTACRIKTFMSQTFRRQEYSTSKLWRQRWLPRKIRQCLSFSLKKSTSTCCTKFCKNPKYHSKNYEVFFRKMSKKYLLGLCCSWLCPSTGNSYLYKFINWNPKLVFSEGFVHLKMRFENVRSELLKQRIWLYLEETVQICIIAEHEQRYERS